MKSRSPRSRSTMLVSVLLLTVVLAAGLAYEAWNAAHSHRVTAERTIREYATFAAWEYNSSIKEMLYSNIAWLFSPIVHEEPVHAGMPLKSPAVLLREEAKQHLCQDDSSLYAFRLDVDSRKMHFVGRPPNAAQQAWIRDTILAQLPSYQRDYSYLATTGHPSRGKPPHSIVYQVKWHEGGEPAAVYGVQFCVESFASGSFATIMRKYQILPPSLTGSRSNDSLFSVVVRDGAGKELFRSVPQYESSFLGKHVLTSYGGHLGGDQSRHRRRPGHRRPSAVAPPVAAHPPWTDRPAGERWTRPASTGERAGAPALQLHRVGVARAAHAAGAGAHVRRDAAARAGAQ